MLLQRFHQSFRKLQMCPSGVYHLTFLWRPSLALFFWPEDCVAYISPLHAIRVLSLTNVKSSTGPNFLLCKILFIWLPFTFEWAIARQKYLSWLPSLMIYWNVPITLELSPALGKASVLGVLDIGFAECTHTQPMCWYDNRMSLSVSPPLPGTWIAFL